MDAPPPVSYQVRRSGFLAGLMIAVWTIGPLLGSFMVIDSGWSGRSIALYGASLAVSATALVWCWRRFPEGNLCWNGERWIWQTESGGSDAENVTHVELSMDLQAAQLLRVQAQGSRKWLWLDRSMDPARWDELRRATAVLPNLPGLKDRHGEAGLP